MQNTLRESVIPVYQDQVYRRQGKHIIIAQVESIVPLHSTLDPNIWGGGTPELTWRRLQHFFGRSPLARHGQMPCHFYTEYLVDDYETFVGCPLSNKSWFLTEAVFQGVLPVVYSDAILVVLQENYSIESMDKRLWEVLAHTVITPLMREYNITNERVLFFEKIANVDKVNSEEWLFRWRDPKFLDPVQLDMYIKEYEKR